MSAETVLPPEGPVGPDKQQETSLLLDHPEDSCQKDANNSSDTSNLKRAISTNEHCADVQEKVKGKSPSHGIPVRSQPQPSACLPLPSEVEANRLHNGLHAGLSNGHKTPCRFTQPVDTSVSSPEPRKHPPPVSRRMQKKLRSSLSVNSDSSRRSKGSSTSSHKPGSSPEDCCVHCILACLFCEFLALCNMVVAQASCGTCTSEACCCCCCADDLGDDCNCPCDMDCGIMDACCESSDCLEICMECCGICFPT